MHKDIKKIIKTPQSRESLDAALASIIGDKPLAGLQILAALPSVKRAVEGKRKRKID